MWIWRYELSYANSFTFMMPFIGARSRTWQSIIWHNGTMADMVDHYRCTVLYCTVHGGPLQVHCIVLYCTVLYCRWWTTTGAESELVLFEVAATVTKHQSIFGTAEIGEQLQ